MKARIKATGQIINVFRKECTSGAVVYEDTNIPDCSPFYHPYREDDLDFLPEKETAVLEGWVARDEEGYINLFQGKPTRDMYDINDMTYGFWDYSNERHIKLPTDSFPSVTWQSEPKKVRITLEAIEE